MRTSVLICLFAGYAALLSARVGGAPPQAPAPPPPSPKHPEIQKPAPAAMTDASKETKEAKDKGEKPPPDFARDVLPIIEDNCLRCHSAASQKGGLILDTHEDIMIGGENGTVLVAGDAAKSRLVQMIRDQIEPKMPPKSTLRPEEIAVFAAWIDAGAKDSTESPLDRLTAKIPSIAPDVALKPAVNALAFRPDGSELAVPGYREVRRVTLAGSGAARTTTAEVATSSPSPRLRGAGRGEGAQPSAASPARTLGGAIDLVRSVAYSRDGKWIAGAGGIPGAVGEVLIWNAETGELAHTLKGHRDYVYQVVFNRRGTRVATCSYDRTVRVWDVETGRPTHVFREHTEAVYSVAFSPNDRWLASAAGDRSVKLWDLASGSRMFTLTEPTGVVQTLAFHPSGLALSAAGADKTIRTWELTPTQNRATDGGEAEKTAAASKAPAANASAANTQTANAQAAKTDAAMPGSAQANTNDARRAVGGAKSEAASGSGADDSDSEVREPPVRVGSEARSIRGHNAAILRIAYSPDGKWLASSDDDGVVKIWETATGKEIRALEKQPDWAQGLDWSPDGTRLAVGRYDGTVGIYDASTGRRVSSLPLDAPATRPAATRPATAPAKKAARP